MSVAAKSQTVKKTNIVGGPSDCCSGKVQKDSLKVESLLLIGEVKQLCPCFCVDLRQHNLDKTFEAVSTEKSHAGLSLGLPEIAVCVDDAMACTSQPT